LAVTIIASGLRVLIVWTILVLLTLWTVALLWIKDLLRAKSRRSALVVGIVALKWLVCLLKSLVLVPATAWAMEPAKAVEWEFVAECQCWKALPWDLCSDLELDGLGLVRYASFGCCLYEELYPFRVLVRHDDPVDVLTCCR
jgi:hypothetical protein